MKIKFCGKEDKETINHCLDYNYKIIEIDNTKIKKNIDLRFKRDYLREKKQLEKYQVRIFIFFKEPNFKYYYYDKQQKKIINLSKNNDYLIVGSQNKIEEVRKVRYNDKQDRFYTYKQ